MNAPETTPEFSGPGPAETAGLLRTLFEIGRDTYVGYRHDKGTLLGAAITYYALFAVGPLLLLSISVAGFLLGEQRASGELEQTLARYVGEDIAVYLNQALDSAPGSRYATTATIIGAGVLLYGAMRLFLRLQSSFNVMWGVRLNKGVARRELVISRLFLLLAAFVPSVLLVASVVVGSVVSWLTGPFDLTATFLTRVAQHGVPAAITWLTFIALFTVLPDVRLRPRQVWHGALATAAAWTIGNTLFGVYLSWSGVSTFYGAAGAVLILLLWAHYMSLIVIVGMKLTRVLYERSGHQIRPEPYAVLVREVTLTSNGDQQPTPE